MGKKYAKKKAQRARTVGSVVPTIWEEQLRTALGMDRVRHDSLAASIEVLCLSGSSIVTIDGKQYTLAAGQTINVRSRG